MSRRRVRWMFVSFAALAAFTAQTTGSHAVAASLEEKTTLSGMVMAPDGQPAAGVAIEISLYHKRLRTRTDATGHFTVEAPRDLHGAYLIARDNSGHMGQARLPL